jgi:ABC-type transport system involved in cytochrome c biogenesis permease subunit
VALAESILMWMALSLYVVAALAGACALVFRKDRAYLVATIAVAAGLAPHTAAFVVRWIATGRPPFINLYELLHASAWAVAVASLVAQLASRAVRSIGAAVMPVAFLTMGYAQMLSPEANRLNAALRSWWLAVHIVFASLAYGCFAVSFGAAILFLYKKRAGERGAAARLPPLAKLDGIGLRCIYFGFICDTVMILLGVGSRRDVVARDVARLRALLAPSAGREVEAGPRRVALDRRVRDSGVFLLGRAAPLDEHTRLLAHVALALPCGMSPQRPPRTRRTAGSRGTAERQRATATAKPKGVRRSRRSLRSRR